MKTHKLYTLYRCPIDEDGKLVGDFNEIVDAVHYVEIEDGSAPEQRLFIKMNELAKDDKEFRYWIESVWRESQD